MRGGSFTKMHPWFKGFQGEIVETSGDKNTYIVRGQWEQISDDELEITELPIRKWTRDYKNYLEELAKNDEVEDIRELHQSNRIHFILKVPKLKEIAQKEGIEKKFKLATSISCNNFVLFSHEGKITRYATEKDILEEFFQLRENLYDMRKQYLLAKLQKEYEILSNKVRFIDGVVKDEIRVQKVKRKDVLQNLKRLGFKTISEINAILNEEKKTTVVIADGQDQQANEEEEIEPEEEKMEVEQGDIPAREYEYLLSMPIMSLTEEKVEELKKMMHDKMQEWERLKAMHIFDLWNQDLDAFLKALDEYEEEEERDRLANGAQNARSGKGRGKRAPAKKQQKPKEDESFEVKPKPKQKQVVAPSTTSAASKTTTTGAGKGKKKEN